ncbi:craniofacial development protein 2-like [Macrobrachium rosenbergii]|uniref:craniofacial development protein 2-like n=1 Tax=Macrobrachium rosenbergii TaxID=79674 RepID=UPI0034D77F88
MMNTRRVDILCVQETRWRGNKAKEIRRGCKLLYSGAEENGRSGVGIIVNSELKEKVVEVKRSGSRIMKVKLMLSEEVLNVISAYAPQAGCDEEEMSMFWRELDEVLTSISEEERVVLGGDLNGHIGTDRRVTSRIHGGLGMGERNEEGEGIIDFAVAFDMALINSFFMKKDYVTYRSGGRDGQIDFLLCRRQHLKEVKDCKVIYGENVGQQHKLVAVDLSIQKGTKGKRKSNPKIKWWELEKAENVELRSRFKENVLREIKLEDDVNDWWEFNSNVILRNIIDDGVANEREVPRISRREVRWALSKMKKCSGNRWNTSRGVEVLRRGGD